MPIDINDLFEHNRSLAQLISGRLPTEQLDGRVQALKPLFISVLSKGLKLHGAILTVAETGYGEGGAVLLRSLFNLVVNAAWIGLSPEKREQRAAMFWDSLAVESKRTEEIFLWDPFDPPGNAKRLIAADERQQRLYEHAEDATRKHKYKKHGNWSKKDLRAMAKDVGLEPYYIFTYQLSSDSEHTSYLSTLYYLEILTKDATRLDPKPTEWMIPAVLATTFEMLAMLAEVSGTVLELGLQDEIDATVKAFQPVKQHFASVS